MRHLEGLEHDTFRDIKNLINFRIGKGEYRYDTELIMKYFEIPRGRIDCSRSVYASKLTKDVYDKKYAYDKIKDKIEKLDYVVYNSIKDLEEHGDFDDIQEIILIKKPKK
jgi:hypothetical protein